ncbi:MAG: hypothetical protein LDL50_02485 [Chloroflexi bacterium]|nr:hypothetical protein [Chloroflexota bacterium]
MKKNLFSRLTKPRLAQRIGNKIRSLFFSEQWTILLARDMDYQSLDWAKFKKLAPPRDHFWADPFVWKHENKFYLFIEDLPYATGRGYIACLTLDENLDVVSQQVVLDKPFHLSYPFLFEYGGQLYMLPEMKHNNRMELYRCERFPDQWTLEKVLLDNARALDGTLLEENGKWWLFVTLHQEGGSSWDNLHLYYADSPLSDEWTPHPCNPIVQDLRSARPAGRIFRRENSLIRPSQDCSVDYGHAMRFNRIVTLNETNYAETCESVFEPPPDGKFLATHTFNSMEGLTAIDAIQLRFRF